MITINKSIVYFVLLVTSLFAGTCLPGWVYAQRVPDEKLPSRPSPPRLVNDLVGMLSPAEQDRLERKLVQYNDSTSSQVTVVIVKSTQPYEPADYAFSIGRKWGVGQKDKDNGLVLLWATGDRKIYIATGRGLEGAIPDGIAKRIISQLIVPNFKQQQYYQGLDAATTEIFRRASGEYKADPKTSSDGEVDPLTILFIFGLVLFFIYIIAKSGRGGRGGGGLRGGSGPIFIPYTTFSGWGSSSGSWGGGGDSGGGGFGGFGGGDFAGGGAGGDY